MPSHKAKRQKPPVPLPTAEELYPETLRLLNCSRCNRLLLAPGQDWAAPTPEPMAARVCGRPVCWRCKDAARRAGLPPENRFAISAGE